MIIGIDFDNTIIDYTNIIKFIIKDRKLKIKKKNPNKDDLKNYIVLNYGEKEWTKLQGQMYGYYIKYAKPTKGLTNFLKKINNKNFQIYIISHKTKFPILGKKINLHNAAKQWCKINLKKKNLIIKYFLQIQLMKK